MTLHLLFNCSLLCNEHDVYVCPNSTVRGTLLSEAPFFVRVYSLLGSESINQSVFNRVPNVPFQSYYVPKVVKKREFSGGEFQFQISIKGKGHHSTLKETNQA